MGRDFISDENRVPVLSFADDTPKWATKVWPFLVQASAANTFYQMKAIAAIVQYVGTINLIYFYVFELFYGS